MSSVSTTYAMAVASLIVALAPVAGFEVFDQGVLETFLTSVLAIGIAVHRVSKGDISWLGIRKSQ